MSCRQIKLVIVSPEQMIFHKTCIEELGIYKGDTLSMKSFFFNKISYFFEGIFLKLWEKIDIIDDLPPSGSQVTQQELT